MSAKSVQIRVPATVGSFAGASDCAAIALDAVLNLTVKTRIDDAVSIRYFGENGERVPRDRSNLVVQALEAALRARGLGFSGADFEIYSSIPVATGLGASTAAVLAGLLAADRLFGLRFDENKLFDLASVFESRPDSLRAALWGGLVVRVEAGLPVSFRRTALPAGFRLAVVVPETPLGPDARTPRKTSENPRDLHRARDLADYFARPENRRSIALYEGLPPMVRKSVPGLDEALRVHVAGLEAVFVCGSGPAVGILAGEDPSEAIQAVERCFARQEVASKALEFRPTSTGARDWNPVEAEIGVAGPKAPRETARKVSLIPV